MPKWIVTTTITTARAYAVEAETGDAAKLHFVADSDACQLIKQECVNEVIVGVTPDVDPSASA